MAVRAPFLQRFKLDNFLVIALSTNMCNKLPPGTHCFEMLGRGAGGDYGSVAFAR